MSRQIEIIPQDSILTRGATTSVLIRVHFDKPTRVRGIKAEFYGAERTEADYTTTSTDSKGKTTTRHHTAVEHVPIVRQNFVLYGEPSEGFFGGMGDAVATMFGGGQSETFEPGDYEFQIELDIPFDSPPSFIGKKCSVFYRLNVQVDVPIWPDPRSDYAFAVMMLPLSYNDSSPVLVQHPDPEKGRGFWDSMLGKDVKVDVAIDSNVLYACHSANAMVAVKAVEAVNVEAISVALIGRESTKANGHRDGYSHVRPLGEVAVNQIISHDFNQEFAFELPNEGPFTSVGHNYSVDWSLEVRLDVPWAKDPFVRIPVRFFRVQGNPHAEPAKQGVPKPKA